MKQIQKKKIEKKDLSDEYNFLENSNDAFNMFTCSENAFVGSNIKSNPGFYVMLISIATQFVFFILLEILDVSTISPFSSAPLILLKSSGL